MNLKESYRYANYLDGLLSTAYTYLRNKGFVTTTVEEHLRKQSNPDVENETIEVQKPFDVEFLPNDVIDFVVKVIEEKEKLSESIAKAKNTTDVNIDNAIAINKKKQGGMISSVLVLLVPYRLLTMSDPAVAEAEGA